MQFFTALVVAILNFLKEFLPPSSCPGEKATQMLQDNKLMSIVSCTICK